MNKSKNSYIKDIATNYLLPTLVDLLCNTLTIELKNKSEFESLKEKNENYVFAFWHGKMTIGWFINRNLNSAALVSKSKDGQILANVLKKWNYTVARGSSHKGGKESLAKLVQFANEGKNIVITPDGPTGPKNKMKAGAIVTAKKTRAKLILAGIGIKNKITLKSWDSFELPMPFTKVSVALSEPISIDENLSYDQTSSELARCEKILNQLEKEAKIN